MLEISILNKFNDQGWAHEKELRTLIQRQQTFTILNPPVQNIFLQIWEYSKILKIIESNVIKEEN